MKKNTFSEQLFERMPLIGILRNYPLKQMLRLADCYEKSGLTMLEITMNSAGAEEAIRLLSKSFSGRLNIGAGTVCSPEDLESALQAGAQFIVMPVVEEEVIRRCVAQNIPVFPGALTPTEVFRAWKLGATMVKVFPAGTMGPRYIRDLLGPLNEIKLLPTGGISTDNMKEYLHAGAKGFGMGSSLIPKRLVENEDWEGLTAHFRTLVQKYHEMISEDPETTAG